MVEKPYYEQDYADKRNYELNKPRITSVEHWKELLKNELELNTKGFDFINKILSVVVGGNPLPLGGGRSLVNL